MSRANLAALERQARDAERAEQIATVQRMERDLVTLHHEDFPAATRPQLPGPEPVDAAEIARRIRQQQLSGISIWRRGDRKAATHRAHQQAANAIAAEQQRHAAAHAHAQADADAQWQRLLDHDPDTVMATLEDAFEDNQSPAACVDVGTEAGVRYATVLALFGPATMVPEHKPATTPAGRPTLRKRTKTDRNQLYAAALGSMVLATVKEGFAVVPSLNEIRILVVRKDPQAATPAAYLTAVYAARFARQPTMNIPWTRIDPAETLLQVDDAMLVRRGSTNEVAALDLSGEPELATLIDQLRTQLQ